MIIIFARYPVQTAHAYTDSGVEYQFPYLK